MKDIDHKTILNLGTITNIIEFLKFREDAGRAERFERYRLMVQQSACREVWQELGRYQADIDWDEQVLLIGMAMARNEYHLVAFGRALPLEML